MEAISKLDVSSSLFHDLWTNLGLWFRVGLVRLWSTSWKAGSTTSTRWFYVKRMAWRWRESRWRKLVECCMITNLEKLFNTKEKPISTKGERRYYTVPRFLAFKALFLLFLSRFLDPGRFWYPIPCWLFLARSWFCWCFPLGQSKPSQDRTLKSELATPWF